MNESCGFYFIPTCIILKSIKDNNSSKQFKALIVKLTKSIHCQPFPFTSNIKYVK